MRTTSLLLASSLLLACGGSTGDGTAPGAAPAATTAPTPAERPAPPPAPTSGEGSIGFVTSLGITSAGAYFGHLEGPGYPPECVAESTTAPDTAGPSASAGLISVDVPDTPKAMELAYDSVTQDYSQTSTGFEIPPGSTIHVHAAGSPQIPAFDADISALAPPEVTAPAAGSDVPAGDLAVSWKPTKDKFGVVLQVGTTQIRCGFDGTAGKGVIPGSLIVPALATSDGSQPADFFALVSHSTTTKAGSFDVAVSHAAGTPVELHVKK